MEHGFNEFDTDFFNIKRFVPCIIEHGFNELDHTSGTEGFLKENLKLIIRVKSIQSVFQENEKSVLAAEEVKSIPSVFHTNKTI
jgi:hypothetical protein